MTNDTLKFEPPEGTPLGDCNKRARELDEKRIALKMALRNMVDMEEYRKVRGEDERFLKLYPRILADAKMVLSMT